MSGALRFATRGSALAQWQARYVADLLRASDRGLAIELVVVETTGDARTDVPLHAIGGQGVFVKEVQQAVLDGRADVAVHSAKDLPSGPPPEGLVLAAVPPRGDPRDALVGTPLADLAPGACVATVSVRRRAQLTVMRPDLVFADLRGNIDTRLAKVPDGGAIVMAMAALDRLGRTDRVAEALSVEQMVPQVGQGALAVECRHADRAVRDRLGKIEAPLDRRFVELERTFLATLGGGCDRPVGAHAHLDHDGQLVLHTFLAGPTGVWQDRRHGPGSDDGWVTALAREAAATAGLP